MSRNSWWLFTFCFLVAAGLGQRSGAAAVEADPTVTINLEDPNGLGGPHLVKAQQIASEIYHRAGVTLQWTVDETTKSDRTLTLFLTTSDAAPHASISEAMGVAPSPGDGTRGTIAYVFVDRANAFAESYRIAVQYVLACALGHEIGHLLLPPNAHASYGIMRGSWHPALFPPKAPGVPGFAPEQARLLRLRARSR